MDEPQQQLRRKILALRIVGAIVVLALGVSLMFLVADPHNPHHSPIAVYVLALAFAVAFLIWHRISRIKTELASLA